MPLLPHPLDDVVKKLAIAPPQVTALAALVVSVRAWKLAYNLRAPRAIAAEYALTQAAVALAALVELNAALARRAAHRDSIGSIYQVAPSGPAPASVARLATAAFLSTPVRDHVAALHAALASATAKVSPSPSPSPAVHPLLHHSGSNGSVEYTLPGGWSGSGGSGSGSASAGAAADAFIADLEDLAVTLSAEFFADVVEPPQAPAGSHRHPTVYPLLEALGPAATAARDWPALLLAIRAAATGTKLANPTLLTYLAFFAEFPDPPFRHLPVDFTGLPDFLQLPQPQCEIIDFWWNLSRFPPLQPFPAVADALSEYLRPDPLARDIWNRYRASALPIPGSSAPVNNTAGANVWHADDLGQQIDPHQPLTPADLAAVFPADASYATSVGDWVVWRLLGWLYLALETENQLYAMRKQLPIAEHARPIALVQSAMNSLRAKYGYTRDVHARLATVALKLHHRPYPLFAPRFHQVTHALLQMHASIADTLARPFLDADPNLWRRVAEAAAKAVRAWASVHAIAIPPDLARSDAPGAPPPPSDLAPMLARVADHNAALAPRFLINPVAVVRDSSAISATGGDEDAFTWLGIRVTVVPVLPAASLIMPAPLLDAVAHVLSSHPSHPHLPVLFGATISQGHWSIVTEATTPVHDAETDHTQLDVLATELTSIRQRVALIRGLVSALWLLAASGIYVRCWPAGRPLQLVRTVVAVSGSSSVENGSAEPSSPPPPSQSLGVIKLPLAEMIGTMVTDLPQSCDLTGIASFVRLLLSHGTPAAVGAIGDTIERAARDFGATKVDSFFAMILSHLNSVEAAARPPPSAPVARHVSLATIGPHSRLSSSQSSLQLQQGSPSLPATSSYGRSPASVPSRSPAPPSLPASSPAVHPIGPIRTNTTGGSTRSSYGGGGSSGGGSMTHLSQPPMDVLASLVSALPLGGAGLTPAPPPRLETARARETWQRALAFYRYGQGDLSGAFNLFAEVATAIPAAQFYMGDILYFGSKTSGLRQDTAQAAVYYARALDFGCEIAAVGLGDCAYFGFSGKRSVAAALGYYERALRAPLADDLTTTDPAHHPLVTARLLARAAAGLADCLYDGGDHAAARAVYERAVALDAGPGGLPLPGIASVASAAAHADDPDDDGARAAARAVARELEVLGAGAGCRKAHARLAEMYVHGTGGVAQDLEAAREFLKRARGCRREVLAKCAYLRATGEVRQADEYQDEYLWRYPLDF
ncbi:hypothetical protein BC828DRAFT_417861 [Blastocladiella britannica]|nr:hypothetical protein BC828DRAFT_417861 [Blastocladiella britannica]